MRARNNSGFKYSNVIIVIIKSTITTLQKLKFRENGKENFLPGPT
jgi:hypothetical protein